MSGWWAVGVVGAGVFAWVVYLDVRHHSDSRLASWWVSRARDWGAWVGPCSFLVSVVALGGYVLAAWLGHVLTTPLGDPAWALALSLPAMLVYAPFVFATAPVDPSGYSAWRSELGDAGAGAGEQRRIAWWAGPPSLAGMIAMIATLASVFVP